MRHVLILFAQLARSTRNGNIFERHSKFEERHLVSSLSKSCEKAQRLRSQTERIDSSKHRNREMPPVLDPINSKVDGLAFLGLSLSRNHYYGRGEGKDGEEGKSASSDEDYNKEGEKLGHPNSYTHQTAFDLNQVIDRDYEFLQATDDNGWCVEYRRAYLGFVF